MLTDKQLHQAVFDALRWEPSIRESEIGIAVRDGVVTLTGTVDSYAEKYQAARTVEKVHGVRGIAQELAVKLPAAAKRTDTEIAHATVNALRWDIQVPDERITSKVENGWVALDGDVEWQYQKVAAERAVRYLTGVRGVTNLIVVKPKHVSPFDVSQKIRDALRHNAEIDAARITVDASEGTVTLEGTVRSYAERMDAERAAWGAPGVSRVVDHLLVNA